jgi:type I restriction enzyme S subunit
MKKGWERRNLGDVCDILDSQRKPITKRDRTSGEYPYYGATGVVDYVGNFIFDEPLVLVGEDGAKWASGDNTAFHVEGKCWVNNHAHVIRPHRKTIIDSWLVYYLIDADLSEFVSGLTVPKLNQGRLREIPIPVPPLSEQQRIVALLDEAFAGISTAVANAERNCKNARAIFESHLEAVFSNRGEGWVEKNLSALFKIGSSKRVLKSEWKTEGVPFYRGREVTRLAADGFVDNELFISEDQFAALSEEYGVPEAGDIVITAIGTIGNAHVVQSSDRFYFKDASVLWMKRTFDVCSEFIKFWLKSSLFFDQLDRGNGATVDTLTIQKLQSISLRLPQLEEQRKIVTELGALTEEIQRLASLYQQKLAALAELKKSLLHRAFSGEL